MLQGRKTSLYLPSATLVDVSCSLHATDWFVQISFTIKRWGTILNERVWKDGALHIRTAKVGAVARYMLPIASISDPSQKKKITHFGILEPFLCERRMQAPPAPGFYQSKLDIGQTKIQPGEFSQETLAWDMFGTHNNYCQIQIISSLQIFLISDNFIYINSRKTNLTSS